MKRLSLILLLLIAIAGCAKKNESGSFGPAQSAAAPAGNVSRYLAYEHSIRIDTEENKVSTIFEAAQTICHQASDDLCTILESRISSGRAASASLKFRANRSGIQKLVSALSKQSDVTDRSTTAEDLASPIEDASKKLAMLNDYRSKLEVLRNRANNDVDALIKVNRELAQVQSELETIAGKHAHLMQRAKTEILNVSIGSIQNRSFWKPIELAIADFGSNLSQGVSVAITGIAYLMPWVIFLLFATWGGRKLWRRSKTPKAST